MLKELCRPVFFLVFLAVLCSCARQPDHNNQVNLYTALYFEETTFYPEQVFDLFSKHGVRSFVLIETNSANGNVDSLSYYVFDEEGFPVELSTKECKSLGCINFMYKETYVFLDGRISESTQFTYKNNGLSVKEKWLPYSQCDLEVFDKMTYSYNNDTILAVSAVVKEKYVTDKEGRAVYQWKKVNDVINETSRNIIYGEDFIKLVYPAGMVLELVLNYESVKVFVEYDNKRNLAREYFFSGEGLPEKVVSYKEKEPFRTVIFEMAGI